MGFLRGDLVKKRCGELLISCAGILSSLWCIEMIWSMEGRSSLFSLKWALGCGECGVVWVGGMNKVM